MHRWQNWRRGCRTVAVPWHDARGDSNGGRAAREVQRRWSARQAPDGDFIMFGDGSLSVMSLLRSSPAGRLGDLRAERWQWAEILRATA